MCISSPAFMSYTVIATSERWNYYSNSSQKLELAYFLKTFIFPEKLLFISSSQRKAYSEKFINVIAQKRLIIFTVS